LRQWKVNKGWMNETCDVGDNIGLVGHFKVFLG